MTTPSGVVYLTQQANNHRHLKLGLSKANYPTSERWQKSFGKKNTILLRQSGVADCDACERDLKQFFELVDFDPYQGKEFYDVDNVPEFIEAFDYVILQHNLSLLTMQSSIQARVEAMRARITITNSRVFEVYYDSKKEIYNAFIQDKDGGNMKQIHVNQQLVEDHLDDDLLELGTQYNYQKYRHLIN
jgi:hypothetical protein